jgi:hypothetical protein
MRAGLAALLVGTLVLAGCATLAGAYGRGDHPSAPSNNEPPPVPDPLPGAEFVEPDPAIGDASPHAVERFVIGPDGRTVVVYWYGGVDSCFGLQRVDVDSSGSVPVITVFEGGRPEAEGMACIMIAVLKATVVTLDEPILADRHGDGTPRGVPDLAIDGALPAVVDPAAVDGWPVAIAAYRLPPSGRMLAVHYIGGTPECYAPAELTVDQEPGRVTVAVWEGSLPGPEACIDIGLLKSVEVELSAPLMVDGALDQGQGEIKLER